jgi:hypothetical protein
MIIVHDQACVNDSGDPETQSQNEAEKKAGDTASHQNGDWRTNHAKEKA